MTSPQPSLRYGSASYNPTSRKQAIRWLYKRHTHEFDFGWYDRRPSVRADYRRLWPVYVVAGILKTDRDIAEGIWF